MMHSSYAAARAPRDFARAARQPQPPAHGDRCCPGNCGARSRPAARGPLAQLLPRSMGGPWCAHAQHLAVPPHAHRLGGRLPSPRQGLACARRSPPPYTHGVRRSCTSLDNAGARSSPLASCEHHPTARSRCSSVGRVSPRADSLGIGRKLRYCLQPGARVADDGACDMYMPSTHTSSEG